jgi:hypothetical protein
MKEIRIISPGQVTADTKVFVGGVEIPQDAMCRVDVEMPVGEVPKVNVKLIAADLVLEHGKEVTHIESQGIV